MKVNYKLNLLIKMKIHPVQYVAILKLVYKEYKPLLYKIDMYKSKKQNKLKIKNVVNR